MSSEKKHIENLKIELRRLKNLVRKLQRRLREKVNMPRSQRAAFKAGEDDENVE